MLPFKLLGAMLLTLSGAYGAILLNRRAKGNIELLDAWISLLRLTKNQIDCFSLPIRDILERCEMTLLLRCGWRGKGRPEDFGELSFSLRRADLTEEGRRIVQDFCAEIGKGYREEQKRTCDYAIGLFSAERDRLLSELPRRRERNTTLCMAAALFMVVLLL